MNLHVSRCLDLLIRPWFWCRTRTSSTFNVLQPPEEPSEPEPFPEFWPGYPAAPVQMDRLSQQDQTQPPDRFAAPPGRPGCPSRPVRTRSVNIRACRGFQILRGDEEEGDQSNKLLIHSARPVLPELSVLMWTCSCSLGSTRTFCVIILSSKPDVRLCGVLDRFH